MDGEQVVTMSDGAQLWTSSTRAPTEVASVVADVVDTLRDDQRGFLLLSEGAQDPVAGGDHAL